MERKYILSEPTDVEVSEEEDAQIRAMIEQAEQDIVDEARVNIRWPKAQLGVIKRAAALFGMPYQTYLKQAAFRQAVDDLKAIRDVCGDEKPGTRDNGET